jgi:hypothetical protein
MNEKQFQRIYKKSFEIDGVLIVPAPLESSGYAVRDGNDKYIFINSRLPHRRKRKIISWGMKKLNK